MAQMPPFQPTTPTLPSGSAHTPWLVLGSCLGSGLLLMFCTVSLIIGGAGSVFSQLSTGSQSGLGAPLASQRQIDAALPIGTPVRSGDLELQVIKTRPVPGTGAQQPRPGNQFHAVTVQATNHSRQSLDLNGWLFMSSLQEGCVRSYRCCVFPLMTDASFPETIAPGATKRVTLVYQAARDADTLYWTYKDARRPQEPQLVVKLR